MKRLMMLAMFALLLAADVGHPAGGVGDFCSMKFPTDRWCWSGSPERDQGKCDQQLERYRVCNDAWVKAIGEWDAFLKVHRAALDHDKEFGCRIMRGCLVQKQHRYKGDTATDWVGVVACSRKAVRGVIENPVPVNDCISKMREAGLL